MESLTSDEDYTVLSLPWAVDLDFGLVDPFLRKIDTCPRSPESKTLTKLIAPTNKLLKKSCYKQKHAAYVRLPIL